MDDELARLVEEPLEWGDSRSERIRDLVRMGLAAEAELKRQELWRPPVQERRHIIMSSIEEYGDETSKTATSPQ